MNKETAERESTLRLILGDSETALSAAEAIERRGKWGEVVRLVFEWKALPELNRQLTTFDIAISGETRGEFRKLSRESFLRSSMVVARGIDAIDAIAREGVNVAAFKGLAIVAVAPERGGRTLQDVDVIVDRGDVMKSVSALETCGYRRTFPGSLDDYFRFVKRSPGFSGNEALLLAATDGGEVDVHWRVGPRGAAMFEPKSLLGRARRVDMKGKSVAVVGMIDGALLTVHHALRNNFVPDDMIRDLLDLESWLTLMENDSELTSFARAACDCRIQAPTLAMIAILHGLRPGVVLERARSALLEDTASSIVEAASKIEELFFLQLREGPLNPDMVDLLRGGALKSIAEGALGGWSRYRSQMEATETRKYGSALPLGRRLNLLCKAVMQARRRHWLLLRTLARSKR